MGRDGAAAAQQTMNLDEKRRLVIRFLERCNAYADRELEKYRGRLDGARGREALEIADRIAHWTAYRTFNEHAIGELESSRLDDWLE